MNLSKRVVSTLLILAIVLFLGLLFWPFLFTNIIQPIGLVLWFLVRILVLGIHQQYFWYGLIFAAFLVLFRLLPKAETEDSSPARLERNAAMINVQFWRVLFVYNGQDPQGEKFLKQKLMNLLTSLYASQQSTSNDFRVYEALKQGRIPLPAEIHTFLFAEEPQPAGGSLGRIFHSVRSTLEKWIRQLTGRDKAKHYRQIEDLLHFLETSLEIKQHDTKL